MTENDNPTPVQVTRSMSAEMGELIASEMTRLEQQASALADKFWKKHWQVRNEAERKDWGYVGVRVRSKNGTPEITWFRARYWKSRNKAGEKKSPTLEYLKKGLGYSYTAPTFRRVKARPWEIEMAMALEVSFAALRREIAMLGKMRRYLHEYQSAVGKRPEGMAELAPVSDTTDIDATPPFDADQTQPEIDPQSESPNPTSGNPAKSRRPGSVEQSSAPVS